MTDPKKIPRKTSSTEQSAKSQHPITTYRGVIEELSKMLIRTSWLDLKRGAPVFTTVEQGLRDTIDNLENLDKISQGTDNLNDALKALNKALKALYSASIVAEDTNSLRRVKYLDFVETCRENLDLADGLLQTNPRET